MSAFDNNFAYALVSSSDRTLKIIGVNAANYSVANANWGPFPAIPALYAGPTLAYNGYGTAENAFSVVEIADGAFNGRTEFAEGGLVLPDTIQRIGENAFNGVKLSGRLTIPASVTHVGANAFASTLIDELVVENESTSDVLSGVVDLTRTTSKETAARAAADTVLNTLKVPKANPAFTGITTIPTAAISVATMTNAAIQVANIATNAITSANIDALTVNGSAKLDGAVNVSGAWNFTSNKPRYNAQALATEAFAQSQVQTLDSARMISTASTLSQIVGTFKQNPDFELHAPQSQAALLQSMTDATNARIGAVSTLASAISVQASAVHSMHAVSSAGISTATSVRASNVASVSVSLETAVSELQSADISMSGVLSDGVSVRNSQRQSLSSAISTAESLLQNADNSLSIGVSSATVVRGLNVSANSAALSAEVSRLQSLDVGRASELTNATSAREGAVSSIASLIAVTAAALEAADTAFGAALPQQTGVRVSEVEALSGAVGAHVLATQSMNAVLLPKLSGSATDATTSTVFNLLDIRVGDSLTFVKSGGSAAFAVDDEISIAYSASDHVSGKVTAVNGSNVAFTVAHKATSASETTIYTTGGAQGPSAVSSSGSHVVPLSSAFVVGSNYVVTSMTGTLFSSVYTDTGYYRMSLLNASNAVIATSLNDEYYNENSASVVTHRFNAAFIPKNATNWKQNFAFTGTHDTQIVVNYSDNKAYTTVKGYAVPYSSGAVLISNGELQRARVSEIGALSSSVRDTMGVLSASVVLNQTNLGSNAAARAASITSIISGTTQSMTSVQTAVSTHGSVLASAVAQRGAGVLSLSAAIATSVPALSSATASLSSALSNQVANRSSQVLAGLTSLVGEAPSSLDTLFEITAALDAGPALYSTITAVETAVSDNIGARTSAVASVAASFMPVVSALQLTDSTLTTPMTNATITLNRTVYLLLAADQTSFAMYYQVESSGVPGKTFFDAVIIGRILTATPGTGSLGSGPTIITNKVILNHGAFYGGRYYYIYGTYNGTGGAGGSITNLTQLSDIETLSSGTSAFISSTSSMQSSVSVGISTTAAARQSGVASISTSLSVMASAFQLIHSTAGISISSAASVRQIGVANASTSLSVAVSGLQSTNAVLSAGISGATSGRQSDMASVSASLSSAGLAQQSHMASLAESFSTLSNGIVLDALANTAAVDSAINQIVGANAVAELDTLNEIAVALNNNATIATTLGNLANTKATTSLVNALSTAVLLKVQQTEVAQLASEVETKANQLAAAQMQTAVQSMSVLLNGSLSTEVQLLQANTTANAAVYSQLSDAVRQVDTLYEHAGLVNADGSINYKVNALGDMVLQSSSLAFTIDANYAITKVAQVVAVQFDATQTSVAYRSRGVEYLLNPIALTNRTHTFIAESSDTTDYANNATAIVITANESALRTAPANSPLSVPKLALSSHTYATPTVQTPYAGTTWSDATGKISQVITINFESGVQRLQIDGTVHDVSGTTEKVVTLEYFPGANPAGALTIKALNSATKVESATLTVANAYNDHPQHAAPAEVAGSKSVSFSDPYYTRTAIYTTTASTVELQMYNVATSTYDASEVAVVDGQVSISQNHLVEHIGQPLFKLRAKTSNGKRVSEFTSVNAEAIKFPPPTISAGGVSYTTLGAGSYRATATYDLNHPFATAVKVINPSTGGTYIANKAASGGSVSFSIDYNESQLSTTVISFAVITLSNSAGHESVPSATQKLLGEYDAPVYANDGSKTITLNESTYTYTANYSSASTAGIYVYSADGTTRVGASTGESSPFRVSYTYSSSQIGQTAFKLSSKETAIRREGAQINVLGEDIPIHSTPVLSGSISYSGNTASMTYNVASGVDAVQVRKAADNSPLANYAVSGTSVSISYDFSNITTDIVVVAMANANGRESAASASQTLLKQFAAPVKASEPVYTTVSAGSYTASMTYTVAAGVTQVHVTKASDIGYVFSNIVVSGTTATITVPFTDADSPVNIVVIAIANAAGRGSAASASQTWLKQFAAPVKASEPVYTTLSAGSYTADMTYAVASGVSRVSVLNSYSVVPTAMVQTLTAFPTLGAKKTWTMTMNSQLGYACLEPGPMYPLYVDFRSDQVVLSTYNGTVWGPEAYIPSGLHNLPRPTTFTVSFDANNFLISYDNNTKFATYPNHRGITSIDGINNVPGLLNATYTGPVIKQPPSWNMRIAFCSTGKNNAWRALIGDMRNSVNVRGWGVWISDSNNIHFSWNGPIWNASPALTVAQNTNYVLDISKTAASLTLALTNLDTNTTQTATNTAMASYIMSANGPVTVGGWINDASENFVGTISRVDAFPEIAFAAVSAPTATTATITVPFTDADAPLNVVAIAQSNSAGRESAASTAQTLLAVFDAPTALSSPTYTALSAGSYRANMTYTVASGVTAVRALGTMTDLYDFETHTFTNAGVAGRLGPNIVAVRNEYANAGATWAASHVNMTDQGIQEWTVPESGSYRIRAKGAASGRVATYGKGRDVELTTTLIRGEIIKILVGQVGSNQNTAFSTSSGGGGTFVVKQNGNVALVVAGGGGGAGYSQNRAPGNDASISESGNNANSDGLGGTNGSGGQNVHDGGGGGFLGNGYGGGEEGGVAFVNGGLGGIAGSGGAYGDTARAEGGFGGGGASSGADGGGGGGGYSGGGGGAFTNASYTVYGSGGGGGSYGITPLTDNGATNNGHGSVIITKVSSNNILPVDVSIVDGVATLALKYADADAPLNITVVALDNSAGRESAASTAQTLLKQYSPPVLWVGFTYSGNTVNMTYNVDSGVDTVQVRKAADNSPLANYAVSGTSVSISYDFSNITTDIVVVAMANANGRESAASTGQTLLKQYSPPTLSGSISYSGNTASMTYNVASGVAGVEVRKATDGSVVSGTTTSVSGTTATITVPLSNTTDIVVVALGNSAGRESAASTAQTLLAVFAAPTVLSSPTYTALSAGSYRANMTYTVASGVTAVRALGTMTDLYDFETHTFTNAGVEGRLGPSIVAVRTAYANAGATWAASHVNMTDQGIQEWTVPESGSYRIRAKGSASGIGGKGRDVELTTTLIRGEIIKILVGQQGRSNPYVQSSGGGGTFVVKQSGNVALVVAGGGGGKGYAGVGSFTDAAFSTSGNVVPNISYGGANGGGGPSFDDGGGGGFLGNGSGSEGGFSFMNGGGGGVGWNDGWSNIDGGFGGGGGGNAYEGGGGGGGYSGGGGGGAYAGSMGGGGGGSYGITPLTDYGATNNGHGSVIITKVSSNNILPVDVSIADGVATLALKYADADAPLNITVVALDNSAGRESAASATQTLIAYIPTILEYNADQGDSFQWDTVSFNRLVGNSYIANTTYIPGIEVPSADKLISVVIHNSVTSIGQSAFSNCDALTSIVIPDSVTIIDADAFYHCSALTTVVIGNSVASIGGSAFASCYALTSIAIPDSVTIIDDDAFYECIALTTVAIGNSVASIGGSAFGSCAALTFVAIPDSVTSIGNDAFDSCDALTAISVGNNNANYSSLNGVLFNKYKTTLIQFPGGKVGSYTTIPDSVTSISPGAFRHANLTSVIIPNSVTSISSVAFYHCSALTSVVIGNSVVSIGNSAFESCVNLTSVVIGNSVVSIGVSAFAECAGLTSITIPDSVTSIGDGAFVNSGLATVIIAGNKVISGITFQSPASGVSFFDKTVTTLLKQFDAPTFSNITYSGNTATIAYAVTSGVTQVELRKASSNFIITTATVTGTTGTITVTVTENINVFLAAVENSAGGRSAASTAQTLLKQYSPPTLSGSISYSGTTASMTYNVASGVDAVQVKKASDGSAISGATTSVAGTTATITVPFTDADSPLNITVVALGNSAGRESAAVTQPLLAAFAAPTLSGSISYSGNTASMTYNVAPGVTALRALPEYKRFVLSNSVLLTNNLTGVQNGQRGTISIWWQFTDATNGFIWSSRSNMVYGEACAMEKIGSNIKIILRNQYDVVGDFVTTSNPISSLDRYHLFASWDLNAGKYHIFINGSSQQLSGNVTIGQTVSYATTITGSGFGASLFGPPGNFVNGYVGLAYINYAEYVDPTTSISKFITAGGRPVSLGPTGALPTGNTPIVFMNSGNGTNSGSGGNFSSYNTVAQLPGVTVQTNTVNTATNTASLVVQCAETIDLVVVALGNSAGRESAASTAQTLLAVFDAPILSGSISYSGNTASMTYTVASGVTAVQVKKASDGSAIAGATTSVSGTTATITVPFTETMNITVVALGNSVGRESAASTAQTLLAVFAAPVLSGGPTYTTLSAGSYRATMTYTVASGVDAVQVRKASDGSVVSGTTTSVSGTTATITVPFTDADAPLNVVAIAQSNSAGQESAASVAQTLLIGKVSYVSVGRHLDGANKNSIACSLDGLNWTSVPNNIFTDYGAAVHHSGKLSRWVAVGQGTNSIAHSTNGVNWFPVENSTAIFSGAGRGVAYSAALSRWVAVGGGTNSIAHSTDGITWDGLGTNHFIGGGGLGVFYSAELSRWVAVGHGTNTSTIAHSTDGVAWTGVATSTSIFSEAGLGVAYGGSRWVAVGQGTHSIAYSTDGITWQGVANSTSIFSTRGQGVAYSVELSRWVAVGRGTNTIAYSTDGITWYGVANSTSIFQTVGNSVSYNSEQSRWVAVGQGINTIAHSTDGITWTAVPNSTSTFNVLGVGIGLLTQFAKPTLSVGPTYTTLSAGSYRATMTYTVASGVDAVQVRKASDGSVVSGTTTSVSGTTATITVPFTETLNIVVVALGNAIGRESAQSAMYSLRQISGSTHYSVVPTAMRQTLAGFPSLGTKNTWTFTIGAQLGHVGLGNNSVYLLYVEFKSDRVTLRNFNGTEWSSDKNIMSGFHDLPRPTTFTVSFDAKSFLISYANGTKTASYPNYYPAVGLNSINQYTQQSVTFPNTDPVFSQPTTWEMRIAFRSTGSHNSWRALVGEMRTNIIDRGWGLWINDSNNLHFSWNGPSWNASPALTVAQNTDYVLDIIKTAASLRLVLTNVAANTTQTAINADMASYMMSANGPVTVGGWINDASENFVGTISFVEVWNSLTSQ